MLDFEDNFSTKPQRISVIGVRADDSELGFLPLLAAAVPMVASLAGSLLSKKSSKTGAPPPEAGQAQNVLDVLTKAIGGNEGDGENSIKEVVRNIVATVPSPVLKQVKEGIKQLQNANKATAQSRTQLVKAVDAKFGPQIHALLAGIKAQQLQTQATDEHKRAVAKSAFRKGTTTTLSAILKRLTKIESRLNGVTLLTPQRAAMFGGRDVLER